VQAAFEKPADQFRLTDGSGLLEDTIVGTIVGSAGRRRSNFQPCGGGRKPISADDLFQDTGLAGGQAEAQLKTDAISC
jgi:hypothetical protein